MDGLATVGVDLGGTHLRGMLLRSDGSRSAVRKVRVGAAREPGAVLERVATLVGELQASAGGERLRGVGLGIAGWVRPSDGAVVRAPNLDWTDVPLQALLTERLGVPVLPMNDLSAVAYGEWRAGAAQGASDALVVFVGTGVGSGLILNGRLHEGGGGFAGEIGHAPLRPVDGAPCGCGRRGCLETVAGGVFIERRVRAAGAAGAFAAVVAAAGGAAEEVTCAHIERAAAAGDPEALALWQEVGVVLGASLGGVGNLLDPDVLVLGGGVVDNCPTLRELVIAQLGHSLLPPIAARLRVVAPALGDPAGVLGAALRASDELL